VSLKTSEELKIQEEYKREWRKKYYSRQLIKLRQQKWQKEYSKLDYVKESHRITHDRYIKSPKGRTTRNRYLKNL